MIEIRNLRKHFGTRLALDDVSFVVEAGRVTAFLGPNGAGKTTTMRILLGLERADSGQALIDGQRFTDLEAPMFHVGALLDARHAHPGRSAFAHLRALALTHGLPASRVEDVLYEVGLSDVAGKRVGGFSLGMRQRLGIAAALLGDPAVLVFDEPVNGLDPEGVRWFRELARHLAAEGRTVFLSSHLISEVALTADHVIVLGKGRVLADAPLADLSSRLDGGRVLVRSPQAPLIAEAAARAGVLAETSLSGLMSIRGLSIVEVGELASRVGATLHELRLEESSLEDAYRSLTGSELEYVASR